MASFHALLSLSRSTGCSLCPLLLGFSRAIRLVSHMYVPQMPPLGCLASVMWDPKDHQATCRAKV